MHQNVVGHMNSVCTYNIVKFVIYILALLGKSDYIKFPGIVPIISLSIFREFCPYNDPSLEFIFYSLHRLLK